MSAELTIYAMIFLAVLAVIKGVYLLTFSKSITLNHKMNRRLEMLRKGSTHEQVLDQLRKEMQQHIRAKSIPIYTLLADKAQKAALSLAPQQLLLLMLAVAAGAFLLLGVFTETQMPVKVVFSAVIGVGGIYLWVSWKAKKRLGEIEEQLPDAIELMVRSLRVGHPFSAAVTIVANEVSDPLATEFGIIADESAYGRDIGEALKDMADRLEIQDLRFLAMAVTIQQQSGGNLAEILSGLSQVIRSRFRLFRRVKAITAEAQWSGKFLVAFPIVALIVINLSDPNYYDEVSTHPLFMPACFAVAFLLLLNLYVMRMLTNIKV